MRTRWDRLDRWCDRASPVLAVAATLAIFWLGMTYGSRAAGGADAFGYVSQAYLWLKGDLRIDQSWSRSFEWPHREESVRPLGYRWGEDRTAIVPTYAPGVPLIMAEFDRLFGTCGPYYVTPAFAALLVAGVFLLAQRLSRSRLTASLATVLMAGSPAFLFNLMFPMSDIVTATLWTWTLVLLHWPGVGAATTAGVLAGLAVLVRPNLVPLAFAGIAAAALWPNEQSRARRMGRTLAFGIWIVFAAMFIARLNQTLYGSAFESGYGETSSLYSLAYLGTNLKRFAAWLIRSESALVAIALLPIISRRFRPDWLARRIGLPLALFVVIVVVSYLFYLPFEEWWYLRFLLPAFPILFLLLAVAIARVAGAVRAPSVNAFAIVIVLLLTAYRWSFADSRGLLRIGYDEQRYVAVGQYIERALPPNAILLAMQHSGTIRYYSGRPTIRYDLFTGARLPSVIEGLPKSGYRPYIVLDDWEEKPYRARLGNDSPIARLEMRVLAEMTAPVKVRIYDPQPAQSGAPPPDPIFIRPSRTCVGPGGPWAR